jgi:hypothetical protein
MVEARSEAEPDSCKLDAPRDTTGSKVDDDAERLENVCGAGL